MNEIGERYWQFLCQKLVSVSDFRVQNYTYLLHFLFEKDFIWLSEFPLDSDRAEDGYALRSDFMNGLFSEEEKYEFWQFCQPKKASCLEVLIALCIRICNEVYSDPMPSVVWLFWTMMDNLGVLWADDTEYDQNIVESCINNWLYRRYLPDGRGGNIFVFPSQKHGNILDFTIWEQANLFMRDVN